MSALSEIKERLAALEARQEERWDAHDKRSAENWHEIKEMFRDFKKHIDDAGKRKDNCFKEMTAHVDRNIKLWLGIPASIAAIIGVFMMIHNILAK